VRADNAIRPTDAFQMLAGGIVIRKLVNDFIAEC
jgi:hypothetical protein